MVDLVAWALALMITWQPIARKPWPETRSETHEETVERYRELAIAAIEVSREHPPLFSEKLGGRDRTAAVLLSIASLESAFYNRVTTTRGKDRERSDFGKSWCAGQIWIGRGGIPGPKNAHYRGLVPEGWKGADLEADPRLCMVTMYRYVRHSMHHCRRAPLELRLGAYTGEGCGPGAVKARNRMRRGLDAPLPVTPAPGT